MHISSSKILIVDDYHSNRVSLERLLEPIANIQIFHADSGNSALKQLIHHQFTLILLDVNMPEMDGYEVASLISATDKHKHIPIVMLTAHTDNQSIQKAYQSGAVDYLIKPIDTTILLNKVKQFVTLNQLQQKTEHLKVENQAIIEAIAQGLIKVSPQGLIEYANASAISLLNVPLEQLLNTPFNMWFQHITSKNDLFSSIQSHFKSAQTYQQKVQLQPNQKPNHQIEITCSKKQTKQEEIIVLFQDITERLTLENELVHLANFDNLTKLANRNYFNQEIKQSLEQAEQQKQSIYLLMLGLDRFKEINDRLGHNVGDQLLLNVATRIQEVLLPNAFAARLGGDEFAVLCKGINLEQAEELARNLVNLIARPFNLYEHEVYIETSIGIVDGKTCQYNKSTLLKYADITLNEAKLTGKNRYKLFNPKMAEKRTAQAQIQQQLRLLLDKKALIVHYQPQYSVNQGYFVGFEALARWPESGYGEQVSPGVFIPLAEQSQLIHQIGEQVLIQTCEQLNAWHLEKQNKHLTISVNLSAKQLNHPLFLERLKDILVNYQFPLEQLIFEVTESAILGNSEAIIRSIHTIKAMGIRLALDDFGTGYSSLNYLQKLPFDVIKIDQCFVRQLGSCKKTEALVQAIISIAEACNMDVIAEGVESNIHHKHVVALGCNKIQGYYYSPALPQNQLAHYCTPTKHLQ